MRPFLSWSSRESEVGSFLSWTLDPPLARSTSTFSSSLLPASKLLAFCLSVSISSFSSPSLSFPTVVVLLTDLPFELHQLEQEASARAGSTAFVIALALLFSTFLLAFFSFYFYLPSSSPSSELS